MKMYVGITDGGWLEFLRARQPKEVNFWRPMAKSAFRAIEPGVPFLFKLHKPNDYIVGGGYFSGYSRVPLSMAWDAFGEDNGAPDFATFRQSIANYRAKRDLTTVDPEIGCIILSNPFFWDEAQWIDPPKDWGAGIMQGKTYDDLVPEDQFLWNEFRARVGMDPQVVQPGIIRQLTAPQGPVLGKKYLRTARLGQGAFRLMTLENYGHKCCITGENTVPVLEAAHIKPVTQEGTHALSNGLLMRADLHILYDKGLIGVDPDFKIRVSGQIREQYLNGKAYYAHEGERLRSLPKDAELQPSRELLEWHMEKVFVS